MPELIEQSNEIKRVFPEIINNTHRGELEEQSIQKFVKIDS